MLEQQLINGLTLGLIYAMIAVGYTMVYGVIELINFAHGEIYMRHLYHCAGDSFLRGHLPGHVLLFGLRHTAGYNRLPTIKERS